ncbi:TetR/AcrR family transcriptional regulator [Nocardia fluminea]|uniref:TetR/AcrR family transcriptional regulator n=1 Tax=Nocardia fluminea TaxID=134984 RepID=UPI00341D014E
MSAYLATSADQIAESAGYSRGAVYSNFGDRERLALEVLDRHLTTAIDAIGDALAVDDVEDRFVAFESWMTAATGNPQWGLLKAELAAAARTSPSLRAELAQRDRAPASLCSR